MSAPRSIRRSADLSDVLPSRSFAQQLRRAVRCSFALLVLAHLCIAAGPVAGREESESKGDAPTRPSIEGKVEARSVGAVGSKSVEYCVSVGDTRYVLQGDDAVLESLAKHKKKWITAYGTIEAGDADTTHSLTIATASDIHTQEPRTLTGVVRVEGSGRDTTYSIDHESGNVEVPSSSDTRKLRKFVGKNVALSAQLASDSTRRIASLLKDVRRELLPGEREPKNERQALAGSWKGHVDVTELPSNSGSATKGKYPLLFRTDEKLKTSSGKVMNLYDVDSIRLRDFNAKKRNLTFDINYKSTAGTYTIGFTGAFDASWRKLSGSWQSPYLGKGTFEVDYQ